MAYQDLSKEVEEFLTKTSGLAVYALVVKTYRGKLHTSMPVAYIP